MRMGVELICYLAVLFVGLVAGLLVGTAMEQGRLSLLPAGEWLQSRQIIDALFGRAMPWFWNVTFLLLIAAAMVNRGAPRWLFASAAVLLLVGMVLTIRIELPINKGVAVWTPATLPANWAELRARWLQFHVVRTWLGSASFVVALAGLMRR